MIAIEELFNSCGDEIVLEIGGDHQLLSVPYQNLRKLVSLVCLKLVVN